MAGYILDSNGVNCTDIDECQVNATACAHDPHTVCVNEPGSWRCDCCTGYHLHAAAVNGTPTCQDVDECADGTALCKNNCTNTPGSYRCSCPAGYQIQNNYTCVDVDECADNSSSCPAEAACRNTPGSWTCDCGIGYLYNASTNSCDDINECADPDRCVNGVCQETVPGDFQCNCDQGYEFYNKTHCKDVDECLQNPCQLACSNTEGSYTCICLHGWRTADNNRTCVREPWNTCEQICEHDGTHINSCLCQCQRNYYTIDPNNSSKCLDVDECQTRPGICGNLTCVNTSPKWYCHCPAGYEREWQSGMCVDIDECDEPSIVAKCNERQHRECVNSPGNYSCRCSKGYERRGDEVCHQIDECARGTSGCEHEDLCVDTAGSFYCRCPAGFKLEPNKLNCSRIECGVPDFRNCGNGSNNCSEVQYNCSDANNYLNSTCRLSCEEGDGYLLDGPETIRCTNSSSWNDETAKCLCYQRVNVTLTPLEITESFGKNASNRINITLRSPKCQSVHNHSLQLQSSTGVGLVPAALQALTLVGDQIKVSQYVGNMVDPRISSANPVAQLHFNILITHVGTTSEVQRESFVLTVRNVPEPPSVNMVNEIKLFTYQDNFKRFITIFERDSDNVTCSIDHPMLELLPSTDFKSWALQVTDGKTFGDIKDIEGTPVTLKKESVKCIDDSPERLWAYGDADVSITINNRWFPIKKIVAEPDEILGTATKGLKIQIRAFGTNSIGKDEESTEFEIRKLETYNDYFELVETEGNDKDKRLLRVIGNEFHESGNLTLTLRIYDTELLKSTEYNASIAVTSENKDVTQTVAIVATVIVVTMFGLATLLYKVFRRPQGKKQQESMVLNPIYSEELQSYYIEMENLNIDTTAVLGRGHFGVVYLGNARHLKNAQKKGIGNDEWVKVAVKELKNDDSYRDAFLKEVKALTTFKHRNIVSLLGIGMCEGIQKYIVMDYMNEGSLKDFLSSLEFKKNSLDRHTIIKKNSLDRVELEAGHFIYMAAQVSDAMTYMEWIGAVHRDLAARNCLVNNKLLVKVADLGSATTLSTASGSPCEYYRVGAKPIPIRWTAPEVLKTMKHSTASDVWSFGVLFWEVLTLCERPYSDLKLDTEVMAAIKGGVKLDIPSDCTVKIADVINSCWEMEPGSRLKFSDIFARLQTILTTIYNIDYTEKKDHLEVDLGIL